MRPVRQLNGQGNRLCEHPAASGDLLMPQISIPKKAFLFDVYKASLPDSAPDNVQFAINGSRTIKVLP